MRKTDIGKRSNHKFNKQDIKTNTHNTPFGVLELPAFVRVPRKHANRRTWKIWYERFVLHPKQMTEYWKNITIMRRLKARKVK